MDRPSPGAGQLLVKVHAASLNPADWKSSEGGQAMLLSFQWPRVFGFDFSGEVVEKGAHNESTKLSKCPFGVGDKVFGMIRGLPQRERGTVAEDVVVESDICARCPENISHAECASVPLVGITAVKMLDACGLKRMQFPVNSEDNIIPEKSRPRVLITGGAGGVGTMAIQLAKTLYGAREIVTTASAGKKTELVLSLGATRVVDYRSE